MPEFHHHPDGLIFVRVDGKQVYVDAVENFNLDGGFAYTFSGRERLYSPGQRHFVDNQPQPLEWAEGDMYIAVIDDLLLAQHERQNPPLTLPEAKQIAQSSILSITGQLIDRLYPPVKKDIYLQKQQEVNFWRLLDLSGLPESVELEWANDWAGRLNAEKWVAVEGPGVALKCFSAADLFAIWAVNSRFAEYIKNQLEPLRTRAQSVIESASSVEDLETIVAGFGAAVAEIPAGFGVDVLPGLLVEYGLQIINSKGE